ncbi:MAG: choice-of-anchor J domain-containing protein, partial [Chitinophagaceae bacterium]
MCPLLYRSYFAFYLATILLALSGLAACVKDDPSTLLPPPVPNQSFREEFDTVASAFQRGWVPVNNSNPKGSGIWMQGGGLLNIFEPYSSRGSFAGFIAADYTSTSGENEVISNWLISPVITMQNGDKISFYTRSQLLPNAFVQGDSTDYGNNLEVCINKKNTGTFIGTTHDPKSSEYNAATDRGDFSLLFSLNPPVYNSSERFWEYRWAHSYTSLFDPLAYPSTWTKFEVTLSGLAAPTQ